MNPSIDYKRDMVLSLGVPRIFSTRTDQLIKLAYGIFFLRVNLLYTVKDLSSTIKTCTTRELTRVFSGITKRQDLTFF
jgi:hypothetical protein